MIRDDECPDDQHQDGHDQQPAAARGEHVVVRSWLDRLQDGDGVKNVANRRPRRDLPSISASGRRMSRCPSTANAMA